MDFSGIPGAVYPIQTSPEFPFGPSFCGRKVQESAASSFSTNLPSPSAELFLRGDTGSPLYRQESVAEILASSESGQALDPPG